VCPVNRQDTPVFIYSSALTFANIQAVSTATEEYNKDNYPSAVVSATAEKIAYAVIAVVTATKNHSKNNNPPTVIKRVHKNLPP
jgi:hypothetical protein